MHTTAQQPYPVERFGGSEGTLGRTAVDVKLLAPRVPLEDLLERVRQRLPRATKVIIAQNDSREELFSRRHWFMREK